MALLALAAACGGNEAAPVTPQPLPPPPVEAGAASAPTPRDAGTDAAPAAASAPLEPAAYLEHVAALHDPPPTDDKGVARLRGAFAKLRALADPRAADDLARYLEASPEPRWRIQAALALAELGDRRAAEHLAIRLGQDTLTLYAKIPELARDDGERIAAARYLADLEWLFPSDAALARLVEKSATQWIAGQPQPHANGMRALALSGSPASLERLRGWADPSAPLPKPGAQPPLPMAFMSAQSGLRYYGAASRRTGKVDEAAKILRKQLQRRPKDLDATMNGLMSGGNAILGMTIRSLGVGAAHGMAETGDARFHDDLLAFVQEPKNNEQARFEACTALAVVATDVQIAALVTKVATSGSSVPAEATRQCLLETLSRRRLGASATSLLPLVERPPTHETSLAVARALGHNGVDAAVRSRLVAALQSPQSRVAAALALLLGAGEEADAELAIKAFGAADPAATEELQIAYNQSFGWVSESDVADGIAARWVKNARASGAPWASAIAARGLQSVEYDNGPRSMTRVRLRATLLRAAKGDDPRARGDALVVLEAMNERGVLASLGRAPAPSP